MKREDRERLRPDTSASTMEHGPPAPPVWPPSYSQAAVGNGAGGATSGAPSPTALSAPPGYRGGISIPQHIVIPPSNQTGPDGKPQPQKFHINSEITISYNNNSSDRSTPNPSDTEAVAGRRGARNPPLTSHPSGQSMQTPPPPPVPAGINGDVRTRQRPPVPTNGQGSKQTGIAGVRDSYGASSSGAESKGHGSTAV